MKSLCVSAGSAYKKYQNIYIYNTCGGEGDTAEVTFLPEARRVVQRLDERVHVACRTQISKPNQRAIILWEEWKKERGGGIRILRRWFHFSGVCVN